MRQLRMTLICGLCFSFAACASTGRTYWYNPDPNANFEMDHKLSLEEAKQNARLTDYDEYRYLQCQSQAGMPAAAAQLRGGLGLGATFARSMACARERDQSLAQARQQEYSRAIAARGWRQVSHTEAVTLGLIK